MSITKKEKKNAFTTNTTRTQAKQNNTEADLGNNSNTRFGRWRGARRGSLAQ